MMVLIKTENYICICVLIKQNHNKSRILIFFVDISELIVHYKEINVNTCAIAGIGSYIEETILAMSLPTSDVVDVPPIS